MQDDHKGAKSDKEVSYDKRTAGDHSVEEEQSLPCCGGQMGPGALDLPELKFKIKTE